MYMAGQAAGLHRQLSSRKHQMQKFQFSSLGQLNLGRTVYLNSRISVLKSKEKRIITFSW